MTPLVTRVWKDDVLVLEVAEGVNLFAAAAQLGFDPFDPPASYAVELTDVDRNRELGEWFCTASDKKAGIWR